MIRKLCPSSRIVLCPVLPTKRSDWTNRGRCFNDFLFNYVNSSNGRVVNINFGEFCDNSTGLLSDKFGKYWQPEDPLHLGSAGIRMLASKIRHCVYGSATSNRSYSSVLQGNTSDASRSRLSRHGTAKLGHSSLAPS